MPCWALAPTPVWAVTTTKQIPQRVSLFLDFLSSELQVQKNPFSHAGSVSPITFHKEQDRNAMDHAPARTLASQ
jgi:hypothetical protein